MGSGLAAKMGATHGVDATKDDAVAAGKRGLLSGWCAEEAAAKLRAWG